MKNRIQPGNCTVAGLALVFLSVIAVLQIISCTSTQPVREPDLKSRKPATEATALSHLDQLAKSDRYLRDIHPIFSNRCVVCHTCIDAPCQLHLDSHAGVTRGATFSEMGSSLFETPPTRDRRALNSREWRSKGFFPMLHEPKDPQEAKDPNRNLQDSILFRLVEQGFKHNKTGFDLDALDEKREGDNACVSTSGLAQAYINKYPAAGMPYGLPALDPLSFETLRTWIADGAPGPGHEANYALTHPTHPEIIDEWETFLNDSVKSQLAARFIYEHTFMTHIHFEGTPQDEFFELVRSRLPAPKPVSEIVTQRPYDPPGSQVYYRFKKVTQAIVRKTHILWELGPTKLLRLKTLFMEKPWLPEGDQNLVDPGYGGTNPFQYFLQIPSEIRYRFMIENSRMIVNQMVRGPVCSGRIATDAIRDHFWVFFLDPSADVTLREPSIGIHEWASLGEKLPNSFSRAIKTYNEAMRRYKPHGFSLDDVWKGDDNNPNAILTILRHETSATVHLGPQGGLPGTVWMMNYSNFERTYYNLVVDYKPWGNELHKLATWTSMSSHRAEAEERFISFLPRKFRSAIRSEWTHGLGAIFENPSKKKHSAGIPTSVQIQEDAPYESLLRQLLEKMPPTVRGEPDMIAKFPKTVFDVPTEIHDLTAWEQGLAAISSKKGLNFARFLPNSLLIRIDGQAYSLITDRAYAFNNIVTLDHLAYEPEKDTVSAYRGIFSDRPGLFVDLTLERASQFLGDLQLIQSETHWAAFKDLFALRRNDPRFWDLLDWFHEWDRNNSPLEAGILDASEYDLE